MLYLLSEFFEVLFFPGFWLKLKGESIPVGLPDVDLSRLRSYFGEERVAKSLKLWSQFISKITAQPVQEMIFAAGSPQDAWRVFESHYAVKSEDERERWKTSGMN